MLYFSTPYLINVILSTSNLPVEMQGYQVQQAI